MGRLRAAKVFRPGPDMLYVATRGTGEGRNAGIASALGITVGCFVHTFALAIGLSALPRCRAAGLRHRALRRAAYLIYLGVHALTHAAPMGQLVYLKPTHYQEISTYNFNGSDYALVRSEVVNRKPAM